MRVIIAGSRTFETHEHFKLMTLKMDTFLSIFKDVEPIAIISGTARGADQLGERYATIAGFDIIKVPADWARYGKSAGYRRNADMAHIATHCVCFWDGRSRGTKHMIDIATTKGLPTRVVLF